MDTISSRENNSYLPVAGVIVGLLAMVLAVVALVKVSSANTKLAAHEEKVAKIDTIESQAATAGAAADKANNDLRKLQSSMQDAVNLLSTNIGTVQASVAKLEEAQKTRAAAPAKGAKGGEPVVAGPGEYVVKGGDTGAKIARANGVSLSDLQAVNPGVNWTKLRVGDKIKLPKK